MVITTTKITLSAKNATDILCQLDKANYLKIKLEDFDSNELKGLINELCSISLN